MNARATADSAPSWRAIRLDNGFGDHAAAWDALARTAPLPHAMLDSRFVGALLEHFGTGREHLCIADGADGPVAMCILVRSAWGTWETFLPSQSQVGLQLLFEGAHLNRLFAALPGRTTRIDLLCIDPLVAPLSLPMLREVPPQRQPQALTINIELEGTFEAYWDARPRKLRENVARYKRRAGQAGADLRFVVLSAAADLDEAVRRFAALESAGWKSAQNSSLSPGNEQEAFYRTVMTQFAGADESRAFELWVGSRLIASRLMIVTRSAIFALKTTYDETMRNIAPGRQLLADVIAYAFEQWPGRRIEFCTNADRDLLAWATGHRDIMHWSVFRSFPAAAGFQFMRLLTALAAGRPPADPVRHVSVQVHEGLAALPEDAAAMLEELEAHDVQLGIRWLRNLEATVFRDTERIRCFVLRHGDVPVAVLPMVEHRRWGATRLRAMSNFYSSLYAPAIRPWLRSQDLAPLIDALRRLTGGLRSVTLEPMDCESRSFESLREALSKGGFATFPYFCFGNWYLEHDTGWSEYLAIREGKLRSTVKRMTQRLTAADGRIEIITDLGDIERGFAAYHQVYANSWKIPEPLPEFMPALMRLCAAQGWMRLGIAWIGDVPVAAQLWIVAGKQAKIFKVAYDEQFKAFSPGTVLTAALMRHVLDVDRVHVVDYLTGDDPYKKTWMTRRRERWGIVAYNPRTLLGFIDTCREYSARLVKSLIGWMRLRGFDIDKHVISVGGIFKSKRTSLAINQTER